MSNELWFHALKVLDTFRTSSESQDVFRLYEFEDNTGILENHKQHLKSMVSHDRLDVKTMYFELIKMLLDQDKNQSPAGFKETRDIDRIQGFQELTNRLQFNLNEKYLTQICDLGQRLGKIEALLEGGDDNLFAKHEKNQVGQNGCRRRSFGLVSYSRLQYHLPCGNQSYFNFCSLLPMPSKVLFKMFPGLACRKPMSVKCFRHPKY